MRSEIESRIFFGKRKFYQIVFKRKTDKGLKETTVFTINIQKIGFVQTI